MSLKIFHVVFMIACIAMSLFVGAWGIWSYRTDGIAGHLALGIGAFVLGGVLFWYAGWFIRKIKALQLP